jgi:hypothetical protein
MNQARPETIKSPLPHRVVENDSANPLATMCGSTASAEEMTVRAL